MDSQWSDLLQSLLGEDVMEGCPLRLYKVHIKTIIILDLKAAVPTLIS